MTHQLENDLITTLDAAAGRAPQPAPNLLDVVEGRRRQKRRARLAVAMSTAVAVIGGSALVYGVTGPASTSSTLDPARTTAAVDHTPAAEKVWPGAVHTVSDRLPNGSKYRQLTMIDDHTILASADASFEKASELWAYDIAAKSARKITNIATPTGATSFADHFAISSHDVAWSLTRQVDGHAYVDVWAAPLDGGKAHRVTTVRTSGVASTIAFTGSKVAFSMLDGGVYTAPLAGGDATLLPGSNGYAILDWPWIGSPTHLPRATSAAHSRSTGSGGVVFKVSGVAGPDAVLYRTIRNVETGEVRVADAGAGQWTCSVTWCAGNLRDGDGERRRRDGSDRRTIPSISVFDMVNSRPVGDRFILASGGHPVLLDLATGRSGRVTNLGGGTRGMGDERLYYAEKKNGYQLIDLVAIQQEDR